MYDHQVIEKKWQDKWEASDLYRAEDFSPKEKFYCLIEFPYASAAGLHVGHVRSYAALDVLSRLKRMQGYNVLYPIGWDAFGLPTENYAIKMKTKPQKITADNIKNFTCQLKSLGLSFDWSRQINTADPSYYRWTQWIFLKLYEKGLAYKKDMPINWCPSCKIGLANEEVLAGKCERCGTQTSTKKLRQWILKITAYADRLAEDLEVVDYSERIKTQQLNWIGRSEGSLVKFLISDSQGQIDVFTTRPDTLFGTTYIVLAPEHELVGKITARKQKKEVRQYLRASKNKSDLERTDLAREKTGVFTGAYAINPVNNTKVPLWVADYVLSSYGSGAIMAVPGHDQRDWEFAKKFNLPIIEVISGGDVSQAAYVNDGKLINSDFLDGLNVEAAIEKIISWLEGKGLGRRKVNYKLRDWIFSRQHYWGEPIPMIYCEKCGLIPVPEKDLPVELPEVDNYEPTETGESPLAAIKEWVNIECPECAGPAQRETDTMPNWAGSNWYFLRYVDPQNDQTLADPKKLKYWTPVDLYNGGMEHTTLHLLYSRFWHKFLYDLKVVPTAEPFARRRSHGMILGEDKQKMSKSRGNVINPDEVVQDYGADSLRLYEMFMGPFGETISWSTRGLAGTRRFLEKVLSLSEKSATAAAKVELERLLHQTIKKVTDDILGFRFNTAVSALMILVNEMGRSEELNQNYYKTLLMILAPFAPHLAEELWEKSGASASIFREKWPEYDPAKAKEEKINLVVQINGKVRAKIQVAINISKDEAEEQALAQEKVQKWLVDKKIKRVIFVAGKLINFVI